MSRPLAGLSRYKDASPTGTGPFDVLFGFVGGLFSTNAPPSWLTDALPGIKIGYDLAISAKNGEPVPDWAHDEAINSAVTMVQIGLIGPSDIPVMVKDEMVAMGLVSNADLRKSLYVCDLAYYNAGFQIEKPNENDPKYRLDSSDLLN